MTEIDLIFIVFVWWLYGLYFVLRTAEIAKRRQGAEFKPVSLFTAILGALVWPYLLIMGILAALNKDTTK